MVRTPAYPRYQRLDGPYLHGANMSSSVTCNMHHVTYLHLVERYVSQNGVMESGPVEKTMVSAPYIFCVRHLLNIPATPPLPLHVCAYAIIMFRLHPILGPYAKYTAHVRGHRARARSCNAILLVNVRPGMYTARVRGLENNTRIHAID
jgi:hypothetical protein